MVSPVDTHSQDFTMRAIRQAAQETGTDFNFLVDTAARESNFDVRAEARTSSAAGMFQFIEQTWLGVMARRGAEHGYEEAAGAISQDANGRFVVSDASQREAILDLRFDAVASARMAGELAAENNRVIEARIGRPASGGELYAAHFLGAGGAAELIAAAQETPDQRADTLFPAAARANRPIFYEDGRARTSREVLAVLTHEGNGSGRINARELASAAAVQGVGNMLMPAIAAADGSQSPDAGYGSISAPSPVVQSVASMRSNLRVGNGELSPALVEILASLDAPRSGRARNS
ncbi:MAG: protein-disulfide isomerase-like protein with CxxC motif [Maricaulis maris]|uniref:Transglycosylase SLT domain-containing protein n=1 Tax=Maricaulis maris (strain MCS10) TaxID=394221 RepID=Q0ANK1_MARMM|nr:hypothetical protein [Maricaulis maris]ABI66136.1 conserved hypothetical protein [Maricaulis maris MCS10]